ncbi:nucleotide-binding protein [Frankia sp. CiP1_Cm_nod1]|uniref:nucleotide-binding protein n=1 Tax=Frankia sp. CiP1_Cm_nod1 TaxID=2897160 RepID=UPI002024DEC3
MSPSSSRSCPPPDPVEPGNETLNGASYAREISYTAQPRQEAGRRAGATGDPQPMNGLTPPRISVNGSPGAEAAGPPGPPGAPAPSPPRAAPPPVAPPGGERGFDPLTSAWSEVAYRSSSSWRSSGPGTPPVPNGIPGGFAVVDRYTAVDDVTAGTVTNTAGPAGPAASDAPAANGRPWFEPPTYDPLFDQDTFISVPPHPSSDRRTRAVPLRHEARPGDARRPPEPPDAGHDHAGPPPGQNHPEQDQRGQEQGTQGRGPREQDHLPHTLASTQHPAPVSPPPPAEPPVGPSTAPFPTVPGGNPLFPDGDSPRGGHRPGPGQPFPGPAGTAFPYPGSPYPSSEYPAPPPAPRPAVAGQQNNRRPPDSNFHVTGGLAGTNSRRPPDNEFQVTGAPAERNNREAPGGDPGAAAAKLGPAAAGNPGEPQRPVPQDGTPGRLMTSALLPARPAVPTRGWRRVLCRISGGRVNPGLSADEARHRLLVEHISAPLNDCHRIAVMSLKGGVGKTTTTVGLGSALASLRGDRIVAIDANPDRGTLGAKVPRASENTVRDLLDNAGSVGRYVDVRRYLSQAASRLEVLASANSPELSQAFTDTDYMAVDGILERYYSILLTDCGTGMLHSAMPAILELADTLVVVSSSSADGGSSASATLDWLDAHGYTAQVKNAVTVISTFPMNRESVDLDALEQHFAARTRRVVRVPYDPHLAVGGNILLEEMRKATRKAFLEIAGAVAERFGLESRKTPGQASGAPGAPAASRAPARPVELVGRIR